MLRIAGWQRLAAGYGQLEHASDALPIASDLQLARAVTLVSVAA
jgi:hypothetical protein